MAGYSVVIPAWNAARTLAETLGSVFAQTLAADEVIVVDDGSTDETAAIAAGYGDKVRVLSQPNAGPGAATTRGFHAACAPVVAFVDADDLWLPEKMAVQMARLAAEPDLQLVTCRQRQFHHGVPDDGTGEERSGMNRSSTVVRRAACIAVGPMIDPPGNRGDMVDWLGRMRAAGHRMEEIDRVLVLRRILPGSMSHGRDPERDRGYLYVVHQALMRKRRAAGNGPGKAPALASGESEEQ